MSRILNTYEITHVIHAAGARTSACAADPALAYESNVLGTEMVFRAIAESESVEKVVLISTAAVYGKVQNSSPVVESAAIHPPTNYAITKASAEMAAAHHAASGSFELVTIRPGFVVHSVRSALADFAKRILNDECHSFLWPKYFYIHSLSDLARSILSLTITNGVEGIYHPPGHVMQLDGFAELLKELADERHCQPTTGTTVDTDLPVPGNLDTQRFFEQFPDFTLDSPKDIFRGVLP